MSTTPWRQHPQIRLPALLARPVRPPRRPFQPGSGRRGRAGESSRHRVQGQTVALRRAPTNPPAGPDAAPSSEATTVVTADRLAGPGGSNHRARAADRPRLAAPGALPRTPTVAREFFVPTRRAAATIGRSRESYRGLAAKRSTVGRRHHVGRPRLRRRVRRHQPEPRVGAPDPVLQPVGRAGLFEGLTAAVSVAAGALQLGSMPDPTVAEIVHGHRCGRQRRSASIPTVSTATSRPRTARTSSTGWPPRG